MEGDIWDLRYIMDISDTSVRLFSVFFLFFVCEVVVWVLDILQKELVFEYSDTTFSRPPLDTLDTCVFVTSYEFVDLFFLS